MCRLPLVFPNFFYGELNIAPKVAEIFFFFFYFYLAGEIPPKRYQINLIPRPLYIKDLLISLPSALCEGKRPGNEIDICRFCVVSNEARKVDRTFCFGKELFYLQDINYWLEDEEIHT